MIDVYTLRSRGATVSYLPQNTLDTTPPETTITSGPSGTIDVGSATFEFSASDNNGDVGLTYSYRLDGGSWSTYSSSTTAVFSGLSEGPHTFEVRAKDASGNVDPTSASQSFTYKLPAPPPPPPVVVVPDTIGPHTHGKVSISRILSKSGIKKYKKAYSKYKRAYKKAKNKVKKARYRKLMRRYLAKYKKIRKGKHHANIKYMAFDMPHKGQSNIVVKIRKRIKSKSRVKRQARYKKLYLKYRNLYRKTRNRTLKRHYKSRAAKYHRAYRRIKVVFYKTVKTVRAGWKNSGQWNTYKYKGSAALYKYYVYATDRAGNKQQNIAKGSFRIK